MSKSGNKIWFFWADVFLHCLNGSTLKTCFVSLDIVAFLNELATFKTIILEYHTIWLCKMADSWVQKNSVLDLLTVILWLVLVEDNATSCSSERPSRTENESFLQIEFLSILILLLQWKNRIKTSVVSSYSGITVSVPSLLSNWDAWLSGYTS